MSLLATYDVICYTNSYNLYNDSIISATAYSKISLVITFGIFLILGGNFIENLVAFGLYESLILFGKHF